MVKDYNKGKNNPMYGKHHSNYCDGDYWHNLPSYIERDKKINEILKFGGYKVIRLWEHDIKVMQLNNLKVKLE